MERISALMDGELAQGEAANVLPAVKQRDELREAWSVYHLIGEAMRGQGCSDCGVAQGVARQLASEPTVLAPRASSGGYGRRWLLPSMAAAAAVAAVSWMGFQSLPGGTGSGAMTPVAFPVEVSPAGPFTTVLDASLPAAQPAPASIQLTVQEYQPYLMAHQPFSPSLAIQGLAPYMRTVSAGAAER